MLLRKGSMRGSVAIPIMSAVSSGFLVTVWPREACGGTKGYEYAFVRFAPKIHEWIVEERDRNDWTQA